eukprot:12057989-Ditylum_brightwellii.AAC.1
MSDEDGEKADGDQEHLTQPEEGITSASSDKAKARIILAIKKEFDYGAKDQEAEIVVAASIPLL